MSNYLGIATVTATLQRMLQQSVQTDVEGARVTTSRPENTGGTPETGISIYLYHLKRNTSLGNADMPPRQRKGELTKRNQLPIDLYYLLSCYGNEIE
ncbi:MAG: Pvc16 family protein, partial [Planktothrix sp.]